MDKPTVSGIYWVKSYDDWILAEVECDEHSVEVFVFGNDNVFSADTFPEYHGPIKLVTMGDMVKEAELANLVKDWWEEHRYDVTGEYGGMNIYDEDPPLVSKAKEIIGDWEKSIYDDLI
jgi:hypothetical protein